VLFARAFYVLEAFKENVTKTAFSALIWRLIHLSVGAEYLWGHLHAGLMAFVPSLVYCRDGRETAELPESKYIATYCRQPVARYVPPCPFLGGLCVKIGYFWLDFPC
jgi:hypothetical protein